MVQVRTKFYMIFTELGLLIKLVRFIRFVIPVVLTIN